MSAPTLHRPVITDPSDAWSDLPTDVHVDPIVRMASNAACGMKENGCDHADHFDILPVVELWKDGSPVVMFTPRHISRDNALAIARIAAGPIRPDVIIATLDAHVTQATTNPKTGKPWGPGEMQASCDDDGACATGLLTDCLVTMAVFRDGHHEMLQRRYRNHETAGQLVWIGEGEEMVSGQHNERVRGYVQDSLMQSLQLAWNPNTNLSQAEDALAVAAAAEGIDEKMQFWHRVCAGATLALLSGAAGSALVCAPDEEVQALVRDSMSDERLNEAREGTLGLVAGLLALKMGIES